MRYGISESKASSTASSRRQLITSLRAHLSMGLMTPRGSARAAGPLLLLLVSVLLTSSAHAQVRVMNWNVARLNGDPVAIEEVFAAAAAEPG